MTKAIILLFAACVVGNVEAAQRAKPVKRPHAFNPLSAPRKLFEERFSSLAVKVSSVGIPQPAPATANPSSRIVK